MTVLPSHLLRKLSPADRASLGRKEAMLPEDCEAVAVAKDERELQKSVRSYLNLHGIEYICPDMRKKSALPPGWPDFTLAYRGKPILLECKTASGKLDAGHKHKHQTNLHPKLTANGWTVLVVRSLAEVQQLFRDIDAVIDP